MGLRTIKVNHLGNQNQRVERRVDQESGICRKVSSKVCRTDCGAVGRLPGGGRYDKVK